MLAVELMREACRQVGVDPFSLPTRGGTDGSRLTEKGLPTPNAFTVHFTGNHGHSGMGQPAGTLEVTRREIAHQADQVSALQTATPSEHQADRRKATVDAAALVDWSG